MKVAPTRPVSSTCQCNRGGVRIKSLAEEECVVGAPTRPVTGTDQCNWGGVLINAPEEGEVASVNGLEVEQGSANDERKAKSAGR